MDQESMIQSLTHPLGLVGPCALCAGPALEVEGPTWPNTTQTSSTILLLWYWKYQKAAVLWLFLGASPATCRGTNSEHQPSVRSQGPRGLAWCLKQFASKSETTIEWHWGITFSSVLYLVNVCRSKQILECGFDDLQPWYRTILKQKSKFPGQKLVQWCSVTDGWIVALFSLTYQPCRPCTYRTLIPFVTTSRF